MPWETNERRWVLYSNKVMGSSAIAVPLTPRYRLRKGFVTDDLVPPGTKIYMLHTIFVPEDKRRQGLGTTLLDKLALGIYDNYGKCWFGLMNDHVAIRPKTTDQRIRDLWNKWLGKYPNASVSMSGFILLTSDIVEKNK